MNATRSSRPLLPLLLASGLGCGFSPAAPGTVASAAALLAVPATGLRARRLLALIALAAGGGLWASGKAGGGADHGWIVIDEVAGQWITLLGLAGLPPAIGGRTRLAWIAAAFALFRTLDIAKPGPVGRLDRRHDAVGVMGDDIVAGLIGAALLAAARLLLGLRRRHRR